MRLLVIVVVLVGTLALHATARAENTEALRRELEQMRQQFDAMKQQYQRAIDTMSERLRRLEAGPAQAPAASPTAPPAAAPTTAPGPASTVQAGPPAPATGSPSAMDLLRPRPPFGLYQQRGAGQLLFDIGLAGDFVGNLTAARVERAEGGTFAGRENRFFPREVELGLFGQVDPYARAEVRIETGEEERGGELAVNLAEAHLTLLTLPFGTQAKLGQVRNRFGYANTYHAHDLPWVDVPNVLRNFFGEEGLVERGVEATIVPDLPFYLEGLVGIFDGDNETAFGRGTLRAPLVTGRLRTFLELTDTSALQASMSVASGETGARHRNTILGWEARYKYRPDGWLRPLVTVTGEALYAMRRVDEDVDLDGDGVADLTRTRDRNRWGFYLGGEVQPFRRWAFGARYDWSEYPEAAGQEWAIEPYVTFSPSEFLRFRLAYKRTERDRFTSATGEGNARSVDEVLFQGTFILGAHPAHPF